MDLGRVIREERLKRGWSLDDLADKLGDIKGSERPSLWKIERGVLWPRPAMLEGLAQAFELKVYQLFVLAEEVNSVAQPEYVAPEEKVVLDNYRHMAKQDRSTYKSLGGALAKQKSGKKPTK